jgi:methyltransferase (TIGR00027 family)
MREGKPSFTAAFVAAARGLRGLDPFAPLLLEGPLGALVRRSLGSSARVATLNVISLGLLDHVEMRTLAIDDAVRKAVLSGVRQLVVLGAGLDARALRMPELRDVGVFEVDHPATQAYKRTKVASRQPLARSLDFVAVDFERDSLTDSLLRAGHDRSAATLWLWEGVTPYLGRSAMKTTLDAIASVSAPGSRLVVTYATPRASPLGTAFVETALVGFRIVGEAIRGMYTPHEMAAELGGVGFQVVEDTAASEWSERFGGGRRLILLVDERLATAEFDSHTKHERSSAGDRVVSHGQARRR